MDETARGNFDGKHSSWGSCFMLSGICSFAFGYFARFSVFLFNATAR